MDKAEQIVRNMIRKDGFSEWMGMSLISVAEGFAEVKMIVREEMLNGHGIAHGGIAYSLADSALAFAANTHGKKALSVDTNITHHKPVMQGDELRAVAEEEHVSRRLGHYKVQVFRGEERVALFKGMVYRLEETWEI
jgi:acyl-CoA thioesterase